MEKQNKSLFMIMLALCLGSMGIMSTNAIIPAINDIFMAFPEAGMGIMNFIVSGPEIVGAVTTLLCGPMVQKLGSKKMLILSFGMITIGTALGALIQNPLYMAVMRGVFGAGMGFYSVVAINVLNELFTDENRRVSMIGIYKGIETGLGAFLSMAGGMLAAMHWSYTFRVYIVFVPVFFLLWFFVPADGKQQAAEIQTAAVEKTHWGKVIAKAAAIFMFFLLYAIQSFFVSTIIVEKGLGSSVEAGIANSLAMIGSFSASMLFGVIYAKLMRWAPFVGFTMMAVSYVMMITAQSFALFAAAVVIIGISQAIVVNYYLTACTEGIPESSAPTAISILSFGSSVAFFLASYVTTLLQSVLKSDTIIGIFPVVAAVTAAGAVISLVLCIKESTQKIKEA